MRNVGDGSPVPFSFCAQSQIVTVGAIHGSLVPKILVISNGCRRGELCSPADHPQFLFRLAFNKKLLYGLCKIPVRIVDEIFRPLLLQSRLCFFFHHRGCFLPSH